MNIAPGVVLGSGGHAKVIISALRQRGVDLRGILCPGSNAAQTYCGLSILGDDSALLDYDPLEISLFNGLGALPGRDRRWRLAKEIRCQGFSFAEVIHKTALVAPDAKIGEGVHVMAGVIIQAGAAIGADSIINTGATIDHDCVVGDSCHIAPGVTLSGGVRVGNGVHIGAGATIIHDIEIGEGCIIAAGTTVYRSVPANHLVKNPKLLITESFKS